METINASEFKARCLAILDQVQTTGERVLILKRGRPVAELLPTSGDQNEYPQLELAGTLTIVVTSLAQRFRNKTGKPSTHEGAA